VDAGRHAVQALEEGLLVAVAAPHPDVALLVVPDARSIPPWFARAEREERDGGTEGQVVKLLLSLGC
jgi:hypothetical protein